MSTCKALKLNTNNAFKILMFVYGGQNEGSNKTKYPKPNNFRLTGIGRIMSFIFHNNIDPTTQFYSFSIKIGILFFEKYISYSPLESTHECIYFCRFLCVWNKNLHNKVKANYDAIFKVKLFMNNIFYNFKDNWFSEEQKKIQTLAPTMLLLPTPKNKIISLNYWGMDYLIIWPPRYQHFW